MPAASGPPGGALRVLITGFGGFAAVHLAEALLDAGHEIAGLARGPSGPRVLAALQARYARLGDDILSIGDVCDRACVIDALERHRPAAVVHLAAQSSVRTGEADAGGTFAVNTVGTLQILSAVRTRSWPCRTVVVSSGECYGRAAGEAPVGEDTPLRPVSVYAVSKAAAELLARQAFDVHGADVVCARPFNHTGPGQSPRFVCSDFARQVVLRERGENSPLRVGNLDAVRDFLDVRDVAAAYVCLLERAERGGTYNVASGTGRRIGDVLEDLLALARRPLRIEPDTERLRAADVPTLIGDSRRLRDLGWQPRVPWRRTLGDLLEDWRRRLA